MAEIYQEFNEELGWIYVPKSIAQILIDVSTIDDVSRKVKILEFHVQALEEEMRRIVAFRPQLPYCTHFLENGDTEVEKKVKNARLYWTNPVQYDNNFDIKNQDNVLHQKSSCQGDQASGSGGKFKHKGDASMPFKKFTLKNKGVDPVSSSAADRSEVEMIDLNVTGENPQLKEPYPQSAPKKQRRCWSPELHEQFGNALQQLGGVDTATPKQIIVIMMNVEGLTNDEVKSHLQPLMSQSWLARDNQRGGVVLVPVVANSDNSQSTNLHVAGGSVPRRGWNNGGLSVERAKEEKSEGILYDLERIMEKVHRNSVHDAFWPGSRFSSLD